MEWIRKNKLTVFLILVVGFLLFKSYVIPLFQVSMLAMNGGGLAGQETAYKSVQAPLGGVFDLSPASAPRREYTPSESKDRLVVEESSISLVVLEVQEKTDEIVEYAQKMGGFMVSSSLSRPEEAPFATVVVRVPSNKLREVLEHFRGLAVKVSSENLWGTDVTDEYEDIGAKLATYEKTKAKFEQVLEKATAVQDILQVQREIINLQSQIDSLKGRQKYLEQTAKLAKITAYLSTDELALPYTPARPFRPKVIFKQAVRSLLKTLRGLAKLAIWLGVYSVIWVPVWLAIVWWRRRRKIKSQKTPGIK